MATKNLLVRVGADFSGFISQSKSGTKAAQQWATQTSSAYSKVSKLTSMISAAFSIATITKGIQAISSAISEVVELGDNIDKQSQRVGLSAEAWQEWDYVMNIAGTSMDNMTVGMKTLTNQIDEAKNGSSSAVEAFQKLGISVDDLNNMSREEAMAAVITGMQGLEDSTSRAALANDLFGRSGQELTPLFNMSASQTQDLTQKYRDLGNVMSTAEVQACASFNDSLTTLKSTFSAIRNSVIVAVLPAFEAFVNFLTYTVAPVVRSVAETISSVLSSLFGISFSSSGGSALSTAASDAGTLSDNLTSAGGSAKALQRQLMGFDEINKLSSTSSGGGGGSSGSSATSLTTTSGAMSQVSNALGTVGTALGNIKAWLDTIDWEPITTAVGTLNSAFSHLGEVLGGAISWAWENILKPLGKWTIEKAAPVLLNALASAIEFVATSWSIALPYYEKFYELVALPILSLGGAALLDFINNMATSLTHITNALKYISSGDWKPAISEIVAALTGSDWSWDNTKEAGESWLTKLFGGQDGLNEVPGWLSTLSEISKWHISGWDIISGGGLGTIIGKGIAGLFGGSSSNTSLTTNAVKSAKTLVKNVNDSLTRSGTVLQIGVESAEQIDSKISGVRTSLQDKLKRDPLVAAITAPTSNASSVTKTASNLTANITSNLKPIRVTAALDGTSAAETGRSLLSTVKGQISAVSISAKANETSGTNAGTTLFQKAQAYLTSNLTTVHAKGNTGAVSVNGSANKSAKSIVDTVQSYFNSNYGTVHAKGNTGAVSVNGSANKSAKSIVDTVQSYLNQDGNMPSVKSKAYSGGVSTTGTAQNAGSKILSLATSQIGSGVAVPAYAGNASGVGANLVKYIKNDISGKQVTITLSSVISTAANRIQSVITTLSANAKGGIFDAATLLGGGNIVGEAGAEAVIPLENNLGYIDSWADTFASKIVSRMGGGGSSGTPVVVQVNLDGRVVGRSAVQYINNTARSTGTNPLSAYI